MTNTGLILLPHEKKALDEFRSALCKTFGRRLKEIKLFGSKVRGTDHATSDLDVAVLLDIERVDFKTRDTVYGLAWEGLHRHDVDISPLIYTVEEFKGLLKRERLIARTISEEGISLY